MILPSWFDYLLENICYKGNQLKKLCPSAKTSCPSAENIMKHLIKSIEATTQVKPLLLIATLKGQSEVSVLKRCPYWKGDHLSFKSPLTV